MFQTALIVKKEGAIMWEKIFNLALQNGLWAVLFLALLIYVLNDSRKREKKYQDTIVDLTKNLGIVQIIRLEVQEIKEIINKITTKKRAKENSNKGNENNETKI